MRRILLSVFRLFLCGIETIGLSIYAPVLGNSPLLLVRDLEASDCLRDLTIQVTANPSNIVYGQSSIVSWSVSLPPGCGYTSIQLNGQPVALSGNQKLTPTQSTSYRVTVFLNLNGVSIEQTASASVIVTDDSVDRFCPNIPLLSHVELWEPDLQQPDPRNQWLTETLNVPNPTILLGPNVLLDFNTNRTSNDEIPLPFGSGVTLLSVCASLPGTPDPSLEDLLPEGSDPAATTSPRQVLVISAG